MNGSNRCGQVDGMALVAVFCFELLARAALVSVLLTLVACTQVTAKWDEEVLLHDERVIVVHRITSAERRSFLESGLGLELENELHFKPMNVHWKGHQPLSAFEIFNGVAYLVVAGRSEHDVCKGKPDDFIPQQLLAYQGDGVWTEVDQTAIDWNIANFNLLQRVWGLTRTDDPVGLMTWKKKSSHDRYPVPPGTWMSDNIPRRPWKLREFFEKNGGTCAHFR